MTLFTIGFTKKNAERFFTLLKTNGVRRLIDTRLNNRSQLAGFSKVDDLPYFLRELAGIEYLHAPALAPTQDLLDRYKKLKGSWADYEVEFRRLLGSRTPEREYSPDQLDHACLLCSEHTPEHCHRRLVAEYFHEVWPRLTIKHLT